MLRRIAGARLATSLTVALASCSGPEPPKVSLLVSPAREVVPAMITLDASASTAPNGTAAGLSARWDFDGDGAFDTEFADALRVAHQYSDIGVHTPRVEVRTPEGGSAIASAMVELVANTPPTAALAMTPPAGKAPLAVTGDASASSDPDEPAANLWVRFDFDGDAVFDTEFSREKSAAWVYRQPGRYLVTVEVKDSRDAVAVAQTKTPVIVEPSADISADTDRDGTITEFDEEGEESYSREHGAVFLANQDDDDADGRKDGRDSVLNGAEDLADLAPLVVRRYEGLEESALVTIRVDDQARPHARIFIEGADGTVSELLAADAAEAAQIPSSRLAAGEVRLFIESVRGRTAEWSGVVTVTLAIARGSLIEEDSVQLRCAPILFPDNTLNPEILYVMRISDRDYGQNLEFYNALNDNLPSGVRLYDVDQYRYGGDRWVQDNMQTGYQIMPVAGGLHVMQTYLETQRPTGPDGLEYLLVSELLTRDLGYAYAGGNDTSLNYGGNLEVVPPHRAGGFEYPYGRILVGGGTEGLLRGLSYEDRMNPEQRALLFAQGAQAPLVEISTEWLAVGHADEILQFVPDVNSTTGRPWKVVIASPALGRQALEDLSAAGLGRERVFPGRDTETTVDEILNDARHISFNELAQARIDSIREILKNELMLTEEDFRDVPVMYEAVSFGPAEFAVAHNPGIQNLVTVGTRLFVPDPEGPRSGGVDVWQALTRQALEPLGLEVVFVDVFYSYHVNMGEAHCGTEVQRAPFAAHWWEQE